MRTISRGKRKARKTHECSAWDFIDADFHQGHGYKCNGIKKGDMYEYQFNADCSDTWEFKACFPCLKFAADNDIDMSGE